MSLPKIVLFTSGQPSLNPRLVKEADALADAGYSVTVIYQYWNAWGTTHDLELLPQKKWKSIRVAGNPNTSKSLYFLSRAIQKLALAMHRSLPMLKTAKWAIARSSYFLYQEAKKHPATLYIGHNLGALPATVLAAKYHKAKCGFDAEDFHRNEVSDDTTSIEYQLKTAIEAQYLPKVDYLTTASPLISEKYHSLFPEHQPVTILNTFDAPVVHPIKNEKEPLKLFWFSQTIGENRGIENVIKAMATLRLPIELHLLGNYNDQTVAYFKQVADEAKFDHNQIFYYPPIPSNEIFAFASRFDIGLATELSTPLNRDICLTNKIFTYLSAGLGVMASDTSAQKQLLEENNGIGSLFSQHDFLDLARKIEVYANNRELLAQTKSTALQLSQTKFNWTIESEKFLNLIQKIIA